MSAPARTFTVRNVQLIRALFAAAAALMITFSPDHSAAVGLSVFSGFAFVSAFVLVLAAWLAVPAGSRWSYLLLAALGFAAGMLSGIPPWRSDDLFFAVVSAWALITGGIELLAGIRARRIDDPTARDSITVGAFGILLGILLLLIPAGLVQEYSIESAGTFELTGIILGVGMLGAYAAIVAVFLGIAGLSPRGQDTAVDAGITEPDQSATPAAADRGGER
ncbi:acyl-CoA synthetase [Microbacterium aurantiacum]|uniref:acyl-CoA synthetase n=1 Tax=Microbacterium aurantiacum TaxID=162393 RepID=UPI000C80ABB6|nr:acyl-CoA synthetase [Microbacterium aurantiacum]